MLMQLWTASGQHRTALATCICVRAEFSAGAVRGGALHKDLCLCCLPMLLLILVVCAGQVRQQTL